MSSVYSDVVNPSPSQRVLLDHSIVTGLIFEYINQFSGNSVILVDGYPSFADAVNGFISAIAINDHKLLGCVNLEVSKRVSMTRVIGRGTRPGEVDVSQSLAEKRYQEHEEFTLKAVKALAKETKVININAEPSLEVVWGSFCQAVFNTCWP